MQTDPERESGYPVWRDRRDGIEVAFVGRGPTSQRQQVLEATCTQAPQPAWATQIHSDTVLTADAGRCGQGDALVTCRTDLTLVLVTADCVPVVLGDTRQLAAIHAGWRGIASNVVAKTAARLLGNSAGWNAWIGPSIGPCCYEVGGDVATCVAAASDPTAVLAGPAGRPHLDLRRAVRIQLADLGVSRVRQIDRCTRCDEDLLWSYRRLGPAAGRNMTFAWLRS